MHGIIEENGKYGNSQTLTNDGIRTTILANSWIVFVYDLE